MTTVDKVDSKVATTIGVEYKLESTSGDCSGVLYEIPNTQVAGGENISMLLWGAESSMLSPYTIIKGTEEGEVTGGNTVSVISDLINEVVDFSESFEYQAEYPIASIVNVQCTSEIYTLTNDGSIKNWAVEGETLTSKFKKKGYSCITSIEGIPLYGSVTLSYYRTPYRKEFFWKVPIGKQGLHWFFIYKNDILKNKFSIKLPDLTSGASQPRNISLRVIAFDSGLPISGAHVTIDGNGVGSTNSDGILNVNDIMSGEVHTLKVTHPDYVDTDLDSLYNDTFSVY